MRLSELRRLSHSPVAVYNYEKTIDISELNRYQYPRYYQVKNKDSIDLYCNAVIDDCVVDDIEAFDSVIIALAHV